MYKRLTAKDLEMQEGTDQVHDSVPDVPAKKWVRYKEGAVFYSMGIHSFMDLAKEAKATYRVKGIVLVNTEKVDEYLELMCAEDMLDA